MRPSCPCTPWNASSAQPPTDDHALLRTAKQPGSFLVTFPSGSAPMRSLAERSTAEVACARNCSWIMLVPYRTRVLANRSRCDSVPPPVLTIRAFGKRVGSWPDLARGWLQGGGSRGIGEKCGKHSRSRAESVHGSFQTRKTRKNRPIISAKARSVASGSKRGPSSRVKACSAG